MSDKPLNAIGGEMNVGKHDFKMTDKYEDMLKNISPLPWNTERLNEEFKELKYPCVDYDYQGCEIKDSSTDEYGENETICSFFKVEQESYSIHTNRVPFINFKANARFITHAANHHQQLVEALELADALLSGANMNTKIVERKIKQALAAAKMLDANAQEEIKE